MEGGEAGGDIVTLAALRVNVVLLDELLWVGSVAPADLQACTWPLLKAMFGAPADTSGFFSLTHDDDGLTLIMDERCNTAFADAAPLAPVSYAPHRWRAFEIHLGSVAAEVPSIICFLSSIMAENHISILNLSTYHRDFLLVRESQVREAIAVLRDSLQHDCTEGLQEAMTELDVRRSIGNGAFLNPHDLDDEVGGKEPGNPAIEAPRGAPTPNACSAVQWRGVGGRQWGAARLVWRGVERRSACSARFAEFSRGGRRGAVHQGTRSAAERRANTGRHAAAVHERAAQAFALL